MEKRNHFILVKKPAMQIETSQTGRRSHSLRIDMTPMVDLGFLLITFFIFSTTLSEPRATNLIMPAEGEGSDLAESRALSVVLASNDRVMVYEGRFEEARKNGRLHFSNYHSRDGFGKFIREQTARLDAQAVNRDRGLMLLIKPLDASTYKNLVDALDETMINDVRRYAVVPAGDEEKKFVMGKLQ